jgi:hexosaminidase
MQTAQLFAHELEPLGFRIPVMFSTDVALRAHDIELMLSPSAAVPAKGGYQMTVSATITLVAPENAGIFYGTRTLLQLFSQDRYLKAGKALDWPRYPQRGMTLDIARKYFSPVWIERQIRELAYLKLNYLHLHISDDEGFGIESTLVSRPAGSDSPRLTKDEVRALVRLSQQYFVSIIPEVDMPGHMGAALAGANHIYQLREPSGHVNQHVLDWSSDAARNFAEDLIREYIDLFDAPYWDAGSDEVLQCLRKECHPALTAYARQQVAAGTPLSDVDGKDALHAFLNELDGMVHRCGRLLRVWNDELQGGGRIPLKDDIVVDWWTNVSLLSDWTTASPGTLLREGHQLMNHGAWPTYYVLGANPLFPNPSMKTAYETWEINQFDGYTYFFGHPFGSQRVAAEEPNNQGAALTVWADHPGAESEDEVAAHISPRLRVIAQKTWGSMPLTPVYSLFEAISTKIGSAGQ